MRFGQLELFLAPAASITLARLNVTLVNWAVKPISMQVSAVAERLGISSSAAPGLPQWVAQMFIAERFGMSSAVSPPPLSPTAWQTGRHSSNGESNREPQK
jgi:hypothetical protein